MRIVWFCAIIMSTVGLFSSFDRATKKDYVAIDIYARSPEAAELHSIPQLSDYLTQKATTDEEKVRSIYVWITEHISYDYTAYLKNKNRDHQNVKNLEIFRKQQADKALQYRTAICLGYATLFQELCAAMDIRSYVIYGNAKSKKGSHCWNAVEIDEKWYLVDVTWGAGKMTDGEFIKIFQEEYFMADPVAFLVDHLPHDPMWQLLEYPLSQKNFEFDSTYVYQQLQNSSRDEFAFNYQDSIRTFLTLSRQIRDIQAAERAVLRNHCKDKIILARAYKNMAAYHLRQIKHQKTESRQKAYSQVARRYYKKALRYVSPKHALYTKTKNKLHELEKVMRYRGYLESN